VDGAVAALEAQQAELSGLLDVLADDSWRARTRRLTSPAGEVWELAGDELPVTTITGPAEELCAVAARRADPSATSLRADGPDGPAVLALVRTYA